MKTWRIFCLELIKLFRTAGNDPEQRPRILDRAQHHYDFIIVGKYCFLCIILPNLLVSLFARAGHFYFLSTVTLTAFCVFFANVVKKKSCYPPMTPTYPGAGKKEVVENTCNLFVASVNSGVGLAINGLQTHFFWSLLIVSGLHNLMTFNSDWHFKILQHNIIFECCHCEHETPDLALHYVVSTSLDLTHTHDTHS